MIYYRQGERILATKVMPEKIFSNIQQHYTFLSNSPATTFSFGRRVGEGLGVGSIIALIGELGCGKTLFTKGICAGLGVPERYVNSPTFVLVNEYGGRLPVFHMDLYQLGTESDVIELGIIDYLTRAESGVMIVEWAEKILSLLPDDVLKVNFQILSARKRRIEFITSSDKYMNLLEGLSES